MKDPRWIGIERHGHGFRARVSQGRGLRPLSRQFPLTATAAEMQAWRKDEQAKLRVTRKQRASRGTFEGDARRYLKTVRALTTYKERERHIGLWIEAFGTTPRDEITSADIRAVRDRWLTEPRGKDQPPLSPHTVNLRLRALSNLYTVLDGRRSHNPVREVDEAHEPERGPRDLDYDTIRRILDKLPDVGRAPKGDKRPKVSLTKIRLRILAYTGLPAKQLMRLKPEDVDLEHGAVSVPGRGKGRGASAALLPLLPPAIDAFRDLHAAQAFGRFTTSSMWKSFQRAAKSANVSGVRPYDLRHSFLTVVYDITRSLEVVMAFAQHADTAMSRQYTKRAALRVMQDETAKLREHFQPSHLG